MASSTGPSGRRRRRGVDLPAGSGRPTESSTSSPTAPAGGTSIAGGGRTPSRLPDGSRVRRAAVGLRHVDLRASTRPSGLVCDLHRRTARWTLATVGYAHAARLTPIDLPYDDIANVRVGRRHRPVTAASQPTGRRSSARPRPPDSCDGSPPLERITIDPAYVSMPQAIEFPTDGGLTAHGFFYPPQNRRLRRAACSEPAAAARAQPRRADRRHLDLARA